MIRKAVYNSLNRFLVLGLLLALSSIASIQTLETPASAAAAPGSDSYCVHHRDGYDPFCFPNSKVSIIGKGFEPGSHHRTYCHVLQSFASGTITVAPHMLGHKIGAAKRIRSGHARQFCVTPPAGTCPRVNYIWQSGDRDTNAGTYPTCGVRWSLPTRSHPTYRFCPVNHAAHVRALVLTRGGKTMHVSGARSGKRACVSESFKHRMRQRIRVRWDNGDGKVSPKEILTDAFYWRLAG